MNSSAQQPPCNILENSTFQSGVSSWQGTGGCEQLTAFPASPFGSPHGPPATPSTSRNSSSYGSNFSDDPNRPSLAGPTGPYIVVSNRTDTWQGPYQIITDRVRLFVTYAVTAWVRIGPPNQSPALVSNVDIALSVDGAWMNVGMVECDSRGWVRCVGSFRLEKKASSVRLYLQGPPPGVDIWLADIRAVPQDPKAELAHLKQKAEQVRKRDIIINITSASSPSTAPSPVTGAHVRMKQRSSSFPIGSCLSLAHIRSPEFRRFFSAHFDFAVFENELKWPRMEWHRGIHDFDAVDSLLTWLEGEEIPVRGHCIFWDNELPPWLPGLEDAQLAEAIDNRVVSLLSRYKGRFAHYDVNNEMLHGGYFNNRLGPGVITRMFQLAKTTDPNALLFMNDYNVEDGKDWRINPRKYAQSIQELLRNGAPVDGIGVQAHITNPVVPHVLDALDVLAEVKLPKNRVAGSDASDNRVCGDPMLLRDGLLNDDVSSGDQPLPVWFTEMDVASSDEGVRADDFEMMLRTAFAHPVVKGVVLWGFWKGGDRYPTCRENAELVNGDWTLNEAGRRLEAILEEWRGGEAVGKSDDGGRFVGRGWLGKYDVSVEWNGYVHHEVVDLDRGVGPKEVDINLCALQEGGLVM